MHVSVIPSFQLAVSASVNKNAFASQAGDDRVVNGKFDSVFPALNEHVDGDPLVWVKRADQVFHFPLILASDFLVAVLVPVNLDESNNGDCRGSDNDH